MTQRVLVVATSRKTRGGITAVIKAHETGELWKKFHITWIQTHRDGNTTMKIWYFVTALLQFLLLVPFCDLVHVHFSEPSSAKRKRIFVAIAKCFHKKVIIHFHSFSVESTIKSRAHDDYVYLFERADLIIVLSQYWKTALIEELHLPKNKIKILFNPCPTIPAPYLQKAQETKHILYAGTVCHRKGYDDFIRAFAKIAPQHSDWKIVLAGNGEIEHGKDIAEHLNIAAQVLFLGWINGEKKYKAFQEATIFCLPSYAEGFPMGVLDAWSFGLPVITTPVGGIPDIAEDGKNMLLFNPGDTDMLAKQLERLIVDEKLRDTIAVASKTLAQTIFNVSSINKQLEKIYEEVLAV